MFESAKLKVKRANQHFADLKQEFEAFVGRKPHRFTVTNDIATGQPIIKNPPC
jgi:hypothetical protein